MYTSIFSTLSARDSNFFDGDCVWEGQKLQDSQIWFSGLMEEVFEQVQSILSASFAEDAGILTIPFSDLVKLAFFPPMILKGLLECKIVIGEKEERKSSFHTDIHHIILHTVQSCLNVYKRNESAIQDLEESLFLIRNMNRGFSQVPIAFLYDSVSLSNTQASLSLESALLVSDIFSVNAGVFMALGNGGIASGMDVFLHSGIEENGACFYPIRFSTRKFKDKTPQLSQVERDFLYEKAKGGKIFLFDEDSSSGNTLEEADAYLRTRVFQQSTYAMSNCGGYKSKSIMNLF